MKEYDIKAIVFAAGVGPEISKYLKQTKPFAKLMEE